jgi:CheY-like chemotaxis protein
MQARTVRLRCIIVDDNPEFLRAARALLETEQISVVASVSTGAQALRSCHELQPDVALVDVDLGTENGFDVARELTALVGNGRPQVIVISASPATEFGEMIDASPAASFLSKAALSAAAIYESLDQPQHSCCEGC